MGKILTWLGATYEALSLQQWLFALPFGGGGVAAMPILGAINDWPLWVQALAAGGVALMWLTILGWIAKQFGPKDPKPVGPTSTVTGPGSAVNIEDSDINGDVVGRDKAGGDIVHGDKEVYLHESPRSEQFEIDLEPVIDAPKIRIRVHNGDIEQPHKFRVTLKAVRPGVRGMNVRNPSGHLPLSLAWSGFNDGEAAEIGPGGHREISLGKIEGGHAEHRTKTFRFDCLAPENIKRRMVTDVPFVGRWDVKLKFNRTANWWE